MCIKVRGFSVLHSSMDYFLAHLLWVKSCSRFSESIYNLYALLRDADGLKGV